MKRLRNGRFAKKSRKLRKTKLRRKSSWPRKMRRTHGKLSKKGWGRRRKGYKGYKRAKGTVKVRGRRYYRRNPFALAGRRGKFAILPSLRELQTAGVQGLGAVGTDVLVSTLYSVANIRPSQSLVEDAAGRILGGSLLAIGAGYLFGQQTASNLRSGTFTVALYKLIAGVIGNMSAGQTPDEKGNVKLFGFVNNPFPADATKKLMPGLGDLMGVVPEGDVIPIGGVVPEGEVVPLGAGEPVASRFATRF